MRAAHGLQVVLRVPVGVKDNHGVGCGEVDAQTARAGGQEERKVGRVLLAQLFQF